MRILCVICVHVLLLLFPDDGVSSDAGGLIDHPIRTSGDSSATTTYLDGDAWIASSPELRLTIVGAHVPGDIITDLQRAGVIDDPYHELNWIRNSSLWSTNTWIYARNFTVTSPAVLPGGNATQLTVFDGIKMGATVKLNGRHELGTVADQFLRYVFPIDGSLLLPGENTNRIEITFGIDDVPEEEGRFMACTGGWDWAPYSYTWTNNNSSVNTTGHPPARSFSKGIWKSVYLVEVPADTVAITHMTPHTKYNGAYPVGPLADGDYDGFTVNVTVHVWVPPSGGGDGGATGCFTIRGYWDDDQMSEVTTTPTTLPPGESRVSVQLAAPADQIRLWWPAGMGGRPLYNVSATWIPKAPYPGDGIDKDHNNNVTAVRRIGFRVFALVTTNDTDASNVDVNATADGSDSHGMFFRVNGAPLYSRGANVVPMEELEGRMSGVAHRIMVKSAADAGMNTLRVWGGGIFLPRIFYEACDEYGIMIYHDMQYASDAGGPHGPVATSMMQDAELRHQIRRLSHHPSIVMWDGGNEVVVTPDTPSEIFSTFVMTTVAQEDRSRAIWPSSPAAGWVTGVNRLYGTPNGNDLTTHGGGHIWDQGIETHAPYQLGSGWPAVNGGSDDTCWDRYNQVHTPPRLDPRTKFGVGERNVYASEFGVTGSPSFESLSATLDPEHWGVHGGSAADDCTGPCQGFRTCTGDNVMAQRNYACDAGIRRFIGTDNNLVFGLNDTGEEALKGQTYLCQLVQALDQKSAIEGRRGRNQFGALVWMLNDIWPSVSWGSLEYGSVGYTGGQLMGGRWKPMHYFYKASLFSDVMATCGVTSSRGRTTTSKGGNWICYVRNDRAGRDFNGTVTFTSYELMGDGNPTTFLRRDVVMSSGPGRMEWFSPPNDVMPDPSTTAVVSSVHDAEDGTLMSEHLLTLAMPRNLRVPRAKVTFHVSDDATDEDGTIDIHVTSDRVALWVTLTSLAHGRFSDNAFFLPATTRTVQFVPFRGVSTDASGAENLQTLRLLKTTLRVEDFSMYVDSARNNVHAEQAEFQ